jgi:hypothetical protein
MYGNPIFAVLLGTARMKYIKMVISDYTLWEREENIFPILVQ